MTFPHSATIQALSKSGGKYTYGTESTSRCFLQPLDDQYSPLYGITFGKGFYCFFPYDTSITENKRVVIDGDTYGVKGVKTHNYGTIKHKRAALELL